MSVAFYTILGLHATEQFQIPEPHRPLTSDVSDEAPIDFSAFEYCGFIIDLSRFFGEGALSPNMPGGEDMRLLADPGMPGAMPVEPNRSDFPAGEEGDAAYEAAMLAYQVQIQLWNAAYEEKMAWDAWQLLDQWLSGAATPPSSAPPRPDAANRGTAEYNEQYVLFLAYQCLEYLAYEAAGEECQEWFDYYVWVCTANNRKRREYRKEKKAYNEAVWQAQHNKALEAKDNAKSAQKTKAFEKQTDQKILQKGSQERKATEQRLIQKMIQRWAQNRAQDKKASQKRNG